MASDEEGEGTRNDDEEDDFEVNNEDDEDDVFYRLERRGQVESPDFMAHKRKLFPDQ